MKIKATDKFSQLGSPNNWGGFGKSVYIELEQGKTVESNNENLDDLLEEGYVTEVKSKSKKKESE